MISGTELLTTPIASLMTGESMEDPLNIVRSARESQVFDLNKLSATVIPKMVSMKQFEKEL